MTGQEGAVHTEQGEPGGYAVILGSALPALHLAVRYYGLYIPWNRRLTPPRQYLSCGIVVLVTKSLMAVGPDMSSGPHLEVRARIHFSDQHCPAEVCGGGSGTHLCHPHPGSPQVKDAIIFELFQGVQPPHPT